MERYDGDGCDNYNMAKAELGKLRLQRTLRQPWPQRGKKVICIDGDIGLRNLDVGPGLENRIVYDLVDVIEGRCPPATGHDP
jgi:septum site-determining protein MinD